MCFVKKRGCYQKHISWGLSFLVRENLAWRYFFKSGSLLSLMFFKMAVSMAFWASSLSLVTSFFYTQLV